MMDMLYIKYNCRIQDNGKGWILEGVLNYDLNIG